MSNKICIGCNKAIKTNTYVKVDGKLFHDGKCVSKHMSRPGGTKITE